MLRKHGVNRDDARILLDMGTGSVRTGQIAAELRDPNGRLTRSPRIVAFYDTAKGRYRALRKTAGSTDHITVAPASPSGLAQSVNELFTDLQTLHERARPRKRGP